MRPPTTLTGTGALVPYLAEAHLTVKHPSTSSRAASGGDEREMRGLEDILSKLNPMAEEFIPPSLASPVGAGFTVPALLPSDMYGYYPTNVRFALLCLTHRHFSSSVATATALLCHIPSPTAVDVAVPLAAAAHHLLSTIVNSMSPSGDHYKPPPFDPFCVATVSPSAPALPLESPLLKEPPSTAPPPEESPSFRGDAPGGNDGVPRGGAAGPEGGGGSGEEQRGITEGGGMVAA
jgi:hypothetical protein